MKLSDILGAASGLAIYAEIALVLFIAAFAGVLVQLASARRAKEWEIARALPLSDPDPPQRGLTGGTDVASRTEQP